MIIVSTLGIFGIIAGVKQIDVISTNLNASHQKSLLYLSKDQTEAMRLSIDFIQNVGTLTFFTLKWMMISFIYQRILADNFITNRSQRKINTVGGLLSLSITLFAPGSSNIMGAFT